MKKYLLPFIILFAFSSFSHSAISPESVIAALKSGNTEELAKYFDSSVEITLPGKSSSYNKNQAKSLLREFFKSVAVKNFEVLHQSENANSQYFIGNLITGTGSYRTTIFMKQKEGKQLIQELRFEQSR